MRTTKDIVVLDSSGETYKHDRTKANHKDYIDMLHEISSVQLDDNINDELINYNKDKTVTITGDDVLIIVDMQNDFMDYANDNTNKWFGNVVINDDIALNSGGAFGVKESTKMDLLRFTRVIKMFKDENAMIIATKDYHPKHHCSFLPKKDGYPPHCVWGTPGAKIVNPILDLLEPYTNTHIVYKGFDVGTDSFSGLEYKNYRNEISPVCGCGDNTKGVLCTSTWTGSFKIEGLDIIDNPKDMDKYISDCKQDGTENFDDKKTGCEMKRLDTILEEKDKEKKDKEEIDNKPLNIFIVGLAGDICVLDTAINAALAGYNVYIIDDLIRIAFIPTNIPGGKGYVNTPIDFLDKIKGKAITLIDSSKINDVGIDVGIGTSFGKRRKSLKKSKCKSLKKSKRKSLKKSKRKSLKKSKRKSLKKSKRKSLKN